MFVLLLLISCLFLNNLDLKIKVSRQYRSWGEGGGKNKLMQFGMATCVCPPRREMLLDTGLHWSADYVENKLGFEWFARKFSNFATEVHRKEAVCSLSGLCNSAAAGWNSDAAVLSVCVFACLQEACGSIVLMASSQVTQTATISVTRRCMHTHSGWRLRPTSFWVFSFAASAQRHFSIRWMMVTKLSSQPSTVLSIIHSLCFCFQCLWLYASVLCSWMRTKTRTVLLPKI